MTIKHFLRNWVLHYIQREFLYLPMADNQYIDIFIQPISYVHSGYQAYGSTLSEFQYFYVDYKNYIDTGTLSLDLKEITDSEMKSIPQEPCLYRIFRQDKTGLKVPITNMDKLDYKCSEKSLFKNRVLFKLQKNVHYFYREEQASEGDILHFDVEEFYINDNNEIIIINSNNNRISTNPIKIENTNQEFKAIQIKHYPKLVKIYANFIYGTEEGNVQDYDGLFDYSNVSWFGSKSPKEYYTNAMAGIGGGVAAIRAAKLHKIYPKITKFTYMEKEIQGIAPSYQEVKRNGSCYVYDSVPHFYINPGTGGMYGGGTGTAATAKKVVYPNWVNNDIYINGIEIFHGDCIEWTDTGSPGYERNQDFETVDYGHYFNVIGDGQGSALVFNTNDSYWWGSTFWKKYVEEGDGLIVHSATYKYLGELPGFNAEFTYVEPFTVYSTTDHEKEGQLEQELDRDDYTKGIDKHICRVKIKSPKYAVKRITTTPSTGKVEVTTTTVRTKDAIGYGWASVEDIVGMASWCMGEFTKYDPDATETYIAHGCGPGMPLYVAFGQYENSKTKDFSKDTYALTRTFDSKDPLIVTDSPLKRKQKYAMESVNYAKYDEEKFKTYFEECDQGCSCIVSYVKQTREGYMKWFNVTDPTQNSNWLIVLQPEEKHRSEIYG